MSNNLSNESNLSNENNQISVRKETVKSMQTQLEIWSQELMKADQTKRDSIHNTGLWMNKISKDLKELLHYWPDEFGPVINSNSITVEEARKLRGG